MTREELENIIKNEYSTEPDYPWVTDPNFAVYRHSNNKKWFALIMDVPRNKIGLSGTDIIDIVNLKCDPVLGASLRVGNGIFPAYHMNKQKWISVALDGSADDEIIKMLLSMSYDATATKIKNKKD